MALTTKQRRDLVAMDTRTGNRVGAAIAMAGLTQAEVAAGTGLTQPYVSAIARGLHQTVTVQNARRFADFFGCSIEDLFPARHHEVAS